jgi:hypothetical protein
LGADRIGAPLQPSCLCVRDQLSLIPTLGLAKRRESRHSPCPLTASVLLDRRLQKRDFGCGESGPASTSPKTLLSAGNAWDFLKNVEERAKGLSLRKRECRPLWQTTSSLPASRAQNQTSSPSGTHRLQTAQPHTPSSPARPRHATTPSPRSTNPSSRSQWPQTQP